MLMLVLLLQPLLPLSPARKGEGAAPSRRYNYGYQQQHRHHQRLQQLPAG
jgi:hypothetical protein